MKRSTRMLLMNNKENQYGSTRDGYRGDMARDNYGVEDKFRDRRGREHYDNGRYAPRDEGDYYVGNQRSRDSRGRYARSEYSEPYGNYGDMRYPVTPYVPPVYERYDNRGEGYRGTQHRPMNKIGFSLDGEMDKIPPEFEHDYRSQIEHQNMDEMAYRRGSGRMSGYGAGDEYMPFDKEMAEEWTKGMVNEDSTHGPHWTIEQTKQVQAQRAIDCDPLEFWVAINAMYSDYSKVAKKNNANTIDFYADMAKAFLDDKDAQPEKLARYYEYIVKH